MREFKKTIFHTALLLSVCLLSACGENDYRTLKGWKNIGQTDTLGLESIAVKIDTLRLITDSLYDITVFGITEDRIFGLTADNVIVIMTSDGQVISSSRRTGRGPGEFANLGGCVYDPYSDEILLLDHWNKVIRLDTDGNFKDEIKNDITPTIGDIMPLSKDSYAATGMSNVSREFCITVLDRNLNPTDRMMPLLNDAQRSTRGIIALEGMREFNSMVMYKPFGEYTYYTVTDSACAPYLEMDFGRYTMPAELYVTVEESSGTNNNFQVDADFICGKYYMVQYLYMKQMCWYYDIYDISSGRRVSHYRYGIEEHESGVEEGFILRFNGQKYGIFPQYIKDNALYWSRFNEDGSTTLFRIQLQS